MLRRRLAVIAGFIATTGLLAGTAAAQQSRYDRCNSKDFNSRISGCTEIIERGAGELVKDRAFAFNNRGNAWLDIGEFDLAIAEYNQAILLDPKHAPAYNNRCAVWRKKGDLDRAVADCDQAIRLDPKYPYAYFNRGNAWAHKGDFDRAIADYDQAIRLDPKNAAAYSIRCVTWNDKGDFDRALADCDEAIRLDPKNAYSYANRGYAWAQKGDLDRAIAEYDEAIRLDPTSASATAAAARHGRRSAISTAPSPTATGPSGSMPPTPRLISIAASPMKAGATLQTPAAI